MGIEILPPDVNLSDHEFVVVDGNIRFGLDAVKGVGFAAVEAIKARRGEEEQDQPAPTTQQLELIRDLNQATLDPDDQEFAARATTPTTRPFVCKPRPPGL